ncbi:MAG: FAD-dependent thymidylate synthase, partial [Oscillospiraceae bacterium]
MKVTLLQYTPEPEKLISCAAKLCYSNNDIDNLYDGLTKEKTDNFIKMLEEIGHESPIEHVCFTFGIEGVSRSLLAQITRHRIASFSVQSQRYVKIKDFKFVTPPQIACDKELTDIYNKSMSDSVEHYQVLANKLEEKHIKTFLEQGMSEKDA